jgi:sphingomyelin phosphodiesterase acid-like 3
VLGNNDTDGHDYQLASGAFLSALGHAWQQELARKDKHLRPDFAAFAKGGYYEVPLAGWKHVRLIALNSTLWSYKFSAANPYADGDAELEWLQSQLSAAYLAGDKVVLLGHIPPGLDAYATRMAHGTRVVTMYRECGDGKSQGGCRDYARAVPAMVQRFHSTIAMGIFGHTHQNEFRVAGEGSSATPLMVVPSISPIFGNNPAFLVVTADAGFHWTDYHAWALPMSQGKQEWYLEYGFDQAYAQPAWNADALLAVTRMLKSQKAARDGFFTRMASGSPSATVPSHWQDAYVCGLNHLTPETVLPCVAESQLDLPLP